MVCSSCSNERPVLNNDHSHLQNNYIILLDLANRTIDSHQANKEKAILNKIFETFLHKTNANFRKSGGFVGDELHVYILPQDPAFTVYESQLNFKRNGLVSHDINKILDGSFAQNFNIKLEDMYKMAIKEPPSSNYNGINGFLSQNLENLLDQESHIMNYIFILTSSPKDQTSKINAEITNQKHFLKSFSNINIMLLELGNGATQVDSTSWQFWLTKQGKTYHNASGKKSINDVLESITTFSRTSLR
jgi:hypothetical protein